MKNTQNIEALIQLMDDPDEGIFLHVRDRLLQYGPDAIPYLENSWEEKDYGLIFLNRVEQLIHDIQFEDVKRQIQHWQNSEKDLLDGAIIIAKYQYPGLVEEHIKEFIETIRKEVWLELSHRQTAYEKVRILNKLFFEKYHFKGDSKNFHSPLNSYINTVIEQRKGNPLSLTIIYSIVAQSLNLPIYGVNLPNHFIAAYIDEDGINQFVNADNKNGVLFYINVFSRGSLFDESEIVDFLKKLNITSSREYFEPCSNTTIIRRMLTNLISSFQQAGNAEKVKELIELRDLLG
ncbi:MAG: transglutaminase-like domain-containing protein [Crocinitomicaceae bacterium]|nr:transglutaminase-like domain-containing protein [Crocinitomicaceae bacterium]